MQLSISRSVVNKKLSFNLLVFLLMNCAAYASHSATLIHLISGKSTTFSLPSDAIRLSIGNPDVADVLLINPREVYLLGKKIGTTNILIWTKDNSTTIMDLSVELDIHTLRLSVKQLMPTEKKIQIDVLGNAVVISGTVSDSIKLQRLFNLVEVFTDSKKIVNLLSVEGSQQVMLEVKVAEVSKTLLDELGFGVNGSRTVGSNSFGVISSLLGTGSGTASLSNGSFAIKLDAEIKKGLVKILAEPTITAISGQEGSFLAGGKIFIPVPQASSSGANTIVLEEREFGVGLKFTPTVLEEGLINLRVTPEVSELSQIGTTITSASGQSSVLPSITTRRASTTVQLRDGESFAIGGLIKNNITEAVKVFPVLGELPILGVLFRSSAFQAERTELVFVVTPHLAKSTVSHPILPTDSFTEPSMRELHWEGRMEGVQKNTPTDSSINQQPRR
jgi:pilus assembly protein CpaC